MIDHPVLVQGLSAVAMAPLHRRARVHAREISNNDSSRTRTPLFFLLTSINGDLSRSQAIVGSRPAVLDAFTAPRSRPRGLSNVNHSSVEIPQKGRIQGGRFNAHSASNPPAFDLVVSCAVSVAQGDPRFSSGTDRSTHSPWHIAD